MYKGVLTIGRRVQIFYTTNKKSINFLNTDNKLT